MLLIGLHMILVLEFSFEVRFKDGKSHLTDIFMSVRAIYKPEGECIHISQMRSVHVAIGQLSNSVRVMYCLPTTATYLVSYHLCSI